MKLLILIVPIVTLLIFVVGYTFGKRRFSDESRASRRRLRENVTLTQQNEAYLSALESIAAGRGGLPEITAAAAIAEAKSYSKEIL